MSRIALFDYGAGNLHSLAKGLEAGGADVQITTDWGEALDRDALVLPGVGSFGAAVRAIEGHEDRVRDALLDGYPCLGICLGMQLLLPESEEGAGVGIGLLPGRVRRLRTRTVPQMGWNDVEAMAGTEETGEAQTAGGRGGTPPDAPSEAPDDALPDAAGRPPLAPDPLLDGLGRFTAYYANSFVCDVEDRSAVIAESEYEGERYPAAVRRARSWGVQFHPEKSSAPGLRLLRNFLNEIER